MRHRRLKVVLLSLGVVLGYGSAIAHYTWHRHHPGWHHDCADMSWDAPTGAVHSGVPKSAPPKAP